MHLKQQQKKMMIIRMCDVEMSSFDEEGEKWKDLVYFRIRVPISFVVTLLANYRAYWKEIFGRGPIETVTIFFYCHHFLVSISRKYYRLERIYKE